MNHIMVDLETLAGPNNNAAITSIAAIKFDLDTGKTHPNFFYKNISLKSSLIAGLQVDAETIEWWFRKDRELSLKMFNNPIPLNTVLYDFAIWVNKDSILWGNSSRFDLGILSNAYKITGIPIPWNTLRNELCYKTLAYLFPYDLEKPKDAHNPVVDCEYQIEKLCNIWKLIKYK